MKNKNTNSSVEISLPELEIHERWYKNINWISHIKPIYWLICVIVLLFVFLKLVPDTMWQYFWSGLKAQGILVSMLIIFSLIALSLVWSTGQRIDVWVLMFFNMHGQRAPWIDWTMLCFTQIGNGIFAMVIAFIVFLRVDHLLAYEITLGTLTLWLVVELVKVIFHRTRPYIKLRNIRIVGSRASGNSFPSGHTSQSFFLVTLMLHYYQGSIYVMLLLYIVASLVGITRIYVGMHYPRDVLGGAILGTSWALIGVIVNNYIG